MRQWPCTPSLVKTSENGFTPNEEKPYGYKRRGRIARKLAMIAGNWNVQSITSKIEEVVEEAVRYNLDIATFTDKKKDAGMEQRVEYINIFPIISKDQKGQSGVSIVAKKIKQIYKKLGAYK